MRIWFSFPHTLGDPGIGTTALHQVRGLVAQGVEVHLFCTNLGAEVPGVASVTETLTLGRRIPHRALGSVQRAYAFHDLRVTRELRRCARPRPDIVHTWPQGCVRTLETARRVGAIGCREAPSPHTAQAFLDAERAAQLAGVALPKGHSHRRDDRRLAREELEFATAEVILAPSDYVRSTFLTRGFAEERVVRHHYGYDPGRFFPTDHVNKQGITAAFIGRGDPAKGLHIALRAWHASGCGVNGRLALCGAMQPDYRRTVAELVGSGGVEELGFVKDVPGVLRQADILILPSLTEGSALVTYEAMGSGCIPVVSDVSGAPATHGQDALIHRAGDLAELTSHLRSLRDSPQTLASLRAGVLARRDELTWGRAGLALVDVYRGLLDGRRARAGGRQGTGGGVDRHR